MTIERRNRTIMVVGGGILGSAVIVGIGVLVITLFNVALNMITYGAFALMLAAFIIMWPTIVRSLKIARRVVDDAVTRANPVEAMKENAVILQRDIDNRKQLVYDAGGHLGVMKATFEKQADKFSETKKLEHLERINLRTRALQTAQQQVKTMEQAYNEYLLLISEAEVDLSMAEADKAFAEALGKPFNYEIKDSTKTALDEITRRIASSQTAMDMSMESLGTGLNV